MQYGWLFGWKEIAKYLHCCVRTAKRYHYEGKMPVLRVNGMGVRGVVGELEIWMNVYCKEKPKSKICNMWKVKKKKNLFAR